MVQLSGVESEDRAVASITGPRPATPAITFDNVAIQRRGRMVWSMATFSIKRGECVALLGPNGSGKTTYAPYHSRSTHSNRRTCHRPRITTTAGQPGHRASAATTGAGVGFIHTQPRSSFARHQWLSLGIRARAT